MVHSNEIRVVASRFARFANDVRRSRNHVHVATKHVPRTRASTRKILRALSAPTPPDQNTIRTGKGCGQTGGGVPPDENGRQPLLPHAAVAGLPAGAAGWVTHTVQRCEVTRSGERRGERGACTRFRADARCADARRQGYLPGPGDALACKCDSRATTPAVSMRWRGNTLYNTLAPELKHAYRCNARTGLRTLS